MTLTGTVWASIGPSPIAQGGRQDNGLVSAIAINPDDSNVIYIGTAGGGVWRTKNALANSPRWEYLSGSFAINAIGSITIDPTDKSI